MLSKCKSARLLILLTLSATILIGCSSKKEQTKMAIEESMTAFSQVLSCEDLDGLTLTIYPKFLDQVVLTGAPETIEGLKERVKRESPDEIATMDTSSLKKNIKLLKQLSEENYEPVEDEVVMDIFYCFVFETSNQAEFLEIALSGYPSGYRLDQAPEEYIYVNGSAVRCSDSVFDILYNLCDQAWEEYFGRLRTDDGYDWTKDN